MLFKAINNTILTILSINRIAYVNTWLGYPYKSIDGVFKSSQKFVTLINMRMVKKNQVLFTVVGYLLTTYR